MSENTCQDCSAVATQITTVLVDFDPFAPIVPGNGRLVSFRLCASCADQLRIEITIGARDVVLIAEIPLRVKTYRKPDLSGAIAQMYERLN